VNTSEVGISIAELASWMDTKGLGHGPITDLALLTGGTQNILLRFQRGRRDYVLRRPPLHLRANSNETMRREARVLRALANSDVPHPRLIAPSDDDSMMGFAFYLMEPVQGFNATTGLPALHAGSETVRHAMGLHLAAAAATLGNLDHVALGLADFGRPDNFLERQVSRWNAQLSSYADLPGWTGPDQLPGVDTIAHWLDSHRPTSFQPGIMHGDYHIANVMYEFAGPQLAAVVDWELATIGDPLLDLGWLLATWPDREDDDSTPVVTPWQGFPSASELVAHYGRYSRRDLSRVHWYEVLACFKLGILLEGTHARACAGNAPRTTGDQLHAQAIALFKRALRRIRC
jgi:aminoglycoside phosphotransferase (APT) family kinase protein